jgi:hypothetical protein
MPILPILTGLAFLTRPDAFIPIFLIMIYRMFGIVKRKGWTVIFLKEITIIGGFIVSLSVFRWSYYGSIVPNTYTLKMTGLPFMFRIRDGMGFTGLFLKSIPIPLIISLIGIGLNFRKKTLLLMSLILSSIAYQIYVGGDPWPYWRVLSPYLPILFILSFGGLSDIARRFVRSDIVGAYISKRNISYSQLEKIIVSSIAFIILLEVNIKFVPEMFLIRAPYKVKANRMKVDTAIALSEITGPDASMAVINAGTLPYYTGLKAIDMLGKSDRHIAQLPPDTSGRITWFGMKSPPGHNKYDLKYSIMTFRPTYVEVFRYGRDNLFSYAQTNYVRVRYKGIFLWLLRDSKDVYWEKIRNNYSFGSPEINGL